MPGPLAAFGSSARLEEHGGPLVPRGYQRRTLRPESLGKLLSSRVATPKPRASAVAPMSKSWAPTGSPRFASSAERRAWMRAATKSNERTGIFARRCSTKASLRVRPARSFALWTPCSNSEAVMAAMATVSLPWAWSFSAKSSFPRSAAMKMLESITTPKDYPAARADFQCAPRRRPGRPCLGMGYD